MPSRRAQLGPGEYVRGRVVEVLELPADVEHLPEEGLVVEQRDELPVLPHEERAHLRAQTAKAPI